jgi:hypothetical protein
VKITFVFTRITSTLVVKGRLLQRKLPFVKYAQLQRVSSHNPTPLAGFFAQCRKLIGATSNGCLSQETMSERLLFSTVSLP